MRKINDLNINTRTYWDQIYGNDVKRSEYAAQGTLTNELIDTGAMLIRPTARFSRTLEEIKDGDRFLDIGCGVGVLTTLVKNTYPNCEVWGSDISKKAIEDNTKENPTIKYVYQHIGSQKEIPSDYFDVVFSGEVLEHLDDPNDLFKDAQRVLKSGGKFVMTTPDGMTIQSPEHVWDFSHDDVKDLYIENGFSFKEFVYLPNMESVMVIYAIGVKL